MMDDRQAILAVSHQVARAIEGRDIEALRGYFTPDFVHRTPGGDAVKPAIPDTVASLTWMQGVRVHTNEDGSKVLEAFIGPTNGVVAGTALSAIGTDRAYTEYHRIGPNPEGVYGLDVANTRSGMKWNFTPLKAIRRLSGDHA